MCDDDPHDLGHLFDLAIAEEKAWIPLFQSPYARWRGEKRIEKLKIAKSRFEHNNERLGSTRYEH